MSLRAGAAMRPIVLPETLLPFDGFTHQHDPLHARVLLVNDGESGIALVSVELTSLGPEEIAPLQQLVAERAAVAPDQVVVAATHTFSAPHLSPHDDGAAGAPSRAFRAALYTAVAEATEHAATALRPAQVTSSTATNKVSVNRDVETADGWWLGADDRGSTDPVVPVVRIADEHDHPIAVLFSCAVQSSVMNESDEGDGRRGITGDLAGAAMRFLETRYAEHGMVAMFLIGAAGDQAPFLTAKRSLLDRDRRIRHVDIGAAGYLLVDLLGERLGVEIARSLEASTQPSGPVPTLGLGVQRHDVHIAGQAAPASFRDLSPSKDYRFDEAGEQTVPIWLVALGPVRIVGLQAELSSVTGRFLREQAAAGSVLVATMVNGGAKYLPDRASYERRTYEAMSARYAAGGAESVVKAISDLIR